MNNLCRLVNFSLPLCRIMLPVTRRTGGSVVKLSFDDLAFSSFSETEFSRMMEQQICWRRRLSNAGAASDFLFQGCVLAPLLASLKGLSQPLPTQPGTFSFYDHYQAISTSLISRCSLIIIRCKDECCSRRFRSLCFCEYFACF